MRWLWVALTGALLVGCPTEPAFQPEVPLPSAVGDTRERQGAPESPAEAPRNAADFEPAELMGLAAGAGRSLVVAHCSGCHSTALITQNRMSRQRWDAAITWMQETQNLWPIPADQRATILDYLAAVQGPLALVPGVNGHPVYPPNPIW